MARSMGLDAVTKAERETSNSRPDAAGRLEPPRWIVPTLVMAGLACRVVQYLWDPSFWTDEASLVLNIRGKAVAQLLGHLDFHQAGPPLFLLSERGMFRLLGGSEMSLRLFPLAAGCASVVLFAILARRVLSPWAAALALALFCFSDRLIWHSTEVKQYGIDVFVAVALLLIAMPICNLQFAICNLQSVPNGAPLRPDPRARNKGIRQSIALCTAATFAIWLSYPAVLMFAGLSLAFLPAMARRGSRGWITYLAFNLPVAVSFALLLGVIRLQQTGSLAEYWAEDFLDLRYPIGWPLWLGRHVLSLCQYAVGPAGIVLLACCVAGTVWLVQMRKLRILALLVNPIGINLLAAAAQRYPFDGARVTVYLTPALFLLGCIGIEGLYFWTRRGARHWALVPGAALLAVVVGGAAFHLVIPRYRGHVRPAVQYLSRHLEPGDGIYALHEREFVCYWSADDPRVRTELTSPRQIPFQRFWIVWSYPNSRVRHRLDGTLRWARTFAAERLSFVGRGGCAYLFEMKPNPPHSHPPDMSTHHKMMSPETE